MFGRPDAQDAKRDFWKECKLFTGEFFIDMELVKYPLNIFTSVFFFFENKGKKARRMTQERRICSSCAWRVFASI